MELGKVVQQLRKERGLTQTELAQKIGKSMRLITYFERGIIEISLDTLYKIADALEVSVCELFIRSEEESQDAKLKILMYRVEDLPEEDRALALDLIATYLAHKEKKK
jgi:transcriptional regulator with XRE-family HTH domain